MQHDRTRSQGEEKKTLYLAEEAGVESLKIRHGYSSVNIPCCGSSKTFHWNLRKEGATIGSPAWPKTSPLTTLGSRDVKVVDKLTTWPGENAANSLVPFSPMETLGLAAEPNVNKPETLVWLKP